MQPISRKRKGNDPQETAGWTLMATSLVFPFTGMPTDGSFWLPRNGAGVPGPAQHHPRGAAQKDTRLPIPPGHTPG